MASELEDVLQTFPEVPDDGVLIKTLYAGICHATHSPQNNLDSANFVGQFSFTDNTSSSAIAERPRCMVC